MIIKIFGPGCLKCEKLKENTEKALKERNIKEAEIQKVSDIEKITEAGIMGLPALMINGEIKAAGRVPDIEEIKEWLKEYKK